MTSAALNGSFSTGALEFPAIIELLRPFLTGPLSEPVLESVQPRASQAEIEGEIAAAKEARDYLLTAPRPRPRPLEDPRPILERLRIDSCEPLEILTLIELARAAGDWSGLFADASFPRLDALARGIPDLRDLVKELGGKILPDGSLDSSASRELARIRRSIELARLELNSKLEQIARRLAREQLLQDDLITIRHGRFVLPVKVERKRQVDGIVHGASASGQSVFVEPLETLPLNNELVELEDREAEEVRRILAEYSGKLRGRGQDLAEAAEALSLLDLAFAKADFARQYGACFPEFPQERGLLLRGARHPLLVRALQASGREAIPLTVELSGPQTIVIVSGPNAGGKTVALKTAGAAVLMAQAGLPVLAEEARLPLFERVLADIGDQQSIEHSLSTFSAHVRMIQRMAEAADEHTLVMLDEIGGSTDPQEGAALAIAILEHFRQRGAMAFVTTHQSRLKAYGAETPQALNAAMDFDEATLQPAYRFITGLPGKSSGIDIAKRLGLDAEIVRRARSLLAPAETEIGALLSSLHARRDEFAAAEALLNERAADVAVREARLKQMMASERQAKLRDLDKRLERTLRDYDEKWKAALEEIRRAAAAAPAKAARQGAKLAREARAEWNTQVLETLDASARPAQSADGAAAELGDRVRVAGVATPGVVTAILDGNEVEVELGRIRMRAPRSSVEIVARAAHWRDGKANSESRVPGPAVESVELAPSDAAEINVIGASSGDACEQVDQFLDRAFLAGRRTARIVHGYGKGILRRSLHQMFASHPHVERFYPAPRPEGGDGVTIVEIKR